MGSGSRTPKMRRRVSRGKKIAREKRLVTNAKAAAKASKKGTPQS
jgi:hypothetical protein